MCIATSVSRYLKQIKYSTTQQTPKPPNHRPKPSVSRPFNAHDSKNPDTVRFLLLLCRRYGFCTTRTRTHHTPHTHHPANARRGGSEFTRCCPSHRGPNIAREIESRTLQVLHSLTPNQQHHQSQLSNCNSKHPPQSKPFTPSFLWFYNSIHHSSRTRPVLPAGP